MLDCLAYSNQQEQFLICLHLSTSAFKPAKSDFDAKLDVSAPVAFFKSVFIAKLDKFSLTVNSLSPPKGSYDLENYLLIVYNIFFYLSN